VGKLVVHFMLVTNPQNRSVKTGVWLRALGNVVF